MVNCNQGGIITMDFNPQQGHEQAGRRSALVVKMNMPKFKKEIV